MSIRVERLSIRDFGPIRHLVLEPGELTVVHGGNEAGKTSCIDALLRALRDRVKPGNRKLVENHRDGPGFQGEIELVLRPADGGPLLALLREHPSLTRLFVVRDGDAALDTDRPWLNSIRGRLLGIDLSRVSDRVRAAASLTPNGTLREARIAERKRLAERRDQIDAFLADLPEIDHLIEHIAEHERRRASARVELEGLRAAARFERYRIALEALAVEQRSRATAAELERYGEEDLDAWNDAVAGVRTAAALAKGAEDEAHRFRERLKVDREDLRKKEAALEQANAIAAECTRRDLPGLIATARLAKQAVRGWSLWRTPAAIGSVLLLALAIGLASRVLSPETAFGLVPLSVVVGAAAAVGLLAAVLAIVATGRMRGARDLEERALAGAGAVLLSVDSLEDCVAALGGIESQAKKSEAERTASADRKRSTEAALDEAERVHGEHSRALDEAQHRVAEVRDRVRLASIDQLKVKLHTRADAESTMRQARQTLASLLGEGADHATLVERQAVDDPGVAADPARLDAAERELEAIDRRLLELRGELTERRDRRLAANGLADLGAAEAERQRLAAAVEALDLETAAAKICLDVLRELELDIDRPLREALGSGPGAAGSYLSRLTGDRYCSIALDGDGALAVERRDGTRFSSDALSRGARDQLALAVRLALVRRLVGEPAFLVLDDAFLSSDPDRREALAASIADLAREGWQILYFTFDPELRDRLATYGAQVIALGPRSTGA